MMHLRLIVPALLVVCGVDHTAAAFQSARRAVSPSPPILANRQRQVRTAPFSIVPPSRRDTRFFADVSASENEAVIDFTVSMIRLCLLMILVSYMPWPKALEEDIPKEYRQGGDKHETYEQLIQLLQPTQDKLDSLEGSVTLVELQDLLKNKNLLDYIQALANKNDSSWKKELEKQLKVLDGLMIKKDDGALYFLNQDDRDEEGVFAIVANTKLKRVLLLFRGSQGIEDWITNLNFLSMTKTEMGDWPKKVSLHKGFCNRLIDEKETFTLYDKIKDKLITTVSYLEDGPSYSLVVAGHSLGGAMATICGVLCASDADLMEKFQGPVQVVSLGSPRVGNHHFRRLHQHLEKNGNLRHVRVMSKDDLIPDIPGISVTKAYTHVGLRWLLTEDSDDNCHVDMEYPDVTRINLPASLLKGSMANHFTWIYDERLSHLAKYRDERNHDLQLSMDDLFDKYLESVRDTL